jgi:CMP/dCMP kinase
MKDMVVTIDGPAGAGKTTVSKKLAERLGYRYVDTGALYRGVALEAKAAGIAPDDDAGLGELCDSLAFSFVPAEGGSRLISGVTDITDHIRTPEITMLASAVSARPVVREYLFDVQRQMGHEKNVVFEGRDMGTVVFPEADAKFFLDASIEERARRRYDELSQDGTLTLTQVQEDIRLRDHHDSTRNQAPLKAADDAVIVDSTSLTVDQVVEKMLAYVQSVA